MTVLVTGATGFLGSALVMELVKQKQPVRVLVRDEAKARAQFGDAVDIVVGEITDAAQVQRAVEGASVVYHFAGRLYHPSTPAELYYRTHVRGDTYPAGCLQGPGGRAGQVAAYRALQHYRRSWRDRQNARRRGRAVRAHQSL